MWRHARGESGTTIVEIVVGLAVGAVLVAGILLLVEQSQKAYMQAAEVTDLQQNVRVAMDRVTRIVQAAGVNPKNEVWGGGTTAFTAFLEAGVNCIRVYSDLNGDGNLNVGGQPEEADENVYFHWDTSNGTALMEQRGTEPGQPDSGSAWVAPGGVAEELARDLEANPGGTAMFRYFTGINDPVSPNVELFPPPASTTTCATLSNADRARISRIVVTITGRACRGGTGSTCPEKVRKTLISDARPRNVP
jgi:hypothetical protein